MKKYISLLLIIFLLMISFLPSTFAEQGKGKITKPKDHKYSIPATVKKIAKENTYPNPSQDMPLLQPSELTEKLIKTSKIKIENPDLIRMLNETTINSTPFALGYKAVIFLGQWPLNYESTETAPNWEYQQINTNYIDNRGGNVPFQIHYVQEAQKLIRGGLTAKIPNSEDVKKMMLLEAAQKTKLPLSFETVIGQGTKNDQVYNVAPKRLGYLYGYAPAVNEKGKVTYGEVYIILKGNKKAILIKNVTSQGIGAWIPIQDHISFSFAVSEQPR